MCHYIKYADFTRKLKARKLDTYFLEFFNLLVLVTKLLFKPLSIGLTADLEK